jgi:lipid A 3-O-deacylase
MKCWVAALVVGGAALPSPASAQEVFAGLFVHEVNTPLSLRTHEDGLDVVLGYRFAPADSLRIVGRPAPYVIASLNTVGDTSFIGGGLGWSLGKGPIYIRPGIGVVLHDGPKQRVEAGEHTELGSRVLFKPEISLGYQLNRKISVEVTWIHVSQGRIFNSRQNPGLDLIGARLNFVL